MIARATPRGQPLLVLGMLLGGWVLVRASLWEAQAPPRLVREEIPRIAPPAAKVVQAQSPVSPPDTGLATSPQGWSIRLTPTGRGAGGRLIGTKEARPFALVASDKSMPESPLVAEGVSNPSVGQANNPLPPSLAPAPFPPPRYDARPSLRRWSGDAWLLVRGDGVGNLAAGRGSYGASQAGAVLRFSILPDSPYRPAVYLRASKAISGAQEAEGALGVSARPIPAVPLRAAAELRVSETSGTAELRPAAYVVTELPPVELPLAFRGEAYAQGGYVWGDYASAFVDGQLRVDRSVAKLGGAEIRAGGGVWGGAQRGAERLDVGPGATLAFDAGRVNARVSVDWRQRIAGDARPASGPALTVAVGF